MKKYFLQPFLFLLVFGSCSINPHPDPRIRILFDDEWLFHRGDIAGAGKLAAVASANPTSTESFQLPQRKTWRGQCMINVQSKKEKGDITITAHTEGIPDNKLILRTE
jgi:hypothetical protein